MNKFLEKYSVPVSIMIAGLFVAGAVLLSNFYAPKNEDALADVSEGIEEETFYQYAAPITDADRILGNKDAKIKVVTYADMECSYCMTFEDTMNTLVSEYNGQVAWVYRHFPLDFHENAMSAAIASECAADVAGEGKFWEFMTKFKDAVNAGGLVDVKAIASSVGAGGSAFDECYSSNKFADKIDGDYNNGIEAGLQGTPYSVVFADGTPVGMVDGAYPIEDVKAAIDPYL